MQIAKKTVLEKFPQAMAWQWADGWVIYSAPVGGEYLCPTTQRTRKAAWESAATRILEAASPSGTGES